MPIFKVHVKWGKEKFSNLECNNEEMPLVFKSQLFALSGVQPDRQKLMTKGAVVNDESWGSVKMRDGMSFLMMGSAERLPEAPPKQTVFIEDMTDMELAQAMELPCGLFNFGNTCYMNATLQCLRSVPELKQALENFNEPSDGGVSANALVLALRDLFIQLDRSSDAYRPLTFLTLLHSMVPRFAETTEQGALTQQDASECLTEVMQCLKMKLPPSRMAALRSNFVDEYFGVQFDERIKCAESDDVPESFSSSLEIKLRCHIDKEVKYMHTGLRNGMRTEITKHSDQLGRDAIFAKTLQISRLPAYLTIEFVRFEYKAQKAIGAKILKDIKFTEHLDMFEFCSETLQQKLIAQRDKFKEYEDKLLEAKSVEKAEENGESKPVAWMETDEPILKELKTAPFWFSDDVGSNNSGYYELQAVLTHKGRNSSSGHYVAWVKWKKDQWVMFDDDRVTPMPLEEILKLSGGGDWHAAYLLIYGPRLLPVDDDADVADEKKDSSN